MTWSPRRPTRSITSATRRTTWPRPTCATPWRPAPTVTPDPDFPEEAIDPFLENTWGDTGRALFNNWLGLVYQLTGLDRHEPFMPGIDPRDPLGIKYPARYTFLSAAVPPVQRTRRFP